VVNGLVAGVKAIDTAVAGPGPRVSDPLLPRAYLLAKYADTNLLRAGYRYVHKILVAKGPKEGHAAALGKVKPALALHRMQMVAVSSQVQDPMGDMDNEDSGWSAFLKATTEVVTPSSFRSETQPFIWMSFGDSKKMDCPFTDVKDIHYCLMPIDAKKIPAIRAELESLLVAKKGITDRLRPSLGIGPDPTNMPPPAPRALGIGPDPSNMPPSAPRRLGIGPDPSHMPPPVPHSHLPQRKRDATF